jgi:hypothetical protein
MFYTTDNDDREDSAVEEDYKYDFLKKKSYEERKKSQT